MRIAILGAAGIMGHELARCLVEDGHTDLLLADLRRDEVAALARELGARATTVDANEVRRTAETLKGSDLVVNAAWYYFNVQVMAACLEAASDYLDLGGLYHVTRSQLERAKAFEDAGRLAILGCGKAPGITNLLVASGTREFDGVHAVHLRSGRRTLGDPPGFHLPYSAQTLLDELTLRPVVLVDGRIRDIDPLSRREIVHHPEPFGDIEYIATLHSELATLPGFVGKGLREMDFKVALPPDTLQALERLVSLGLASDQEVEVEGRRLAPRRMTAAALSRLPVKKGREVWITEAEMVGERDGSSVTLLGRVTGTERENGTALAAATGVDLLAHGRLRGTGVQAPETVIPPGEFFRGLRRRGLQVTETRTEVREPGS